MQRERDGAFIRFVRPSSPLPSFSFIPFSVSLIGVEWSAVAVGTVKKERGGETLICQWAETELCNCNNTDDDDPLVPQRQ